MKAINRRDFLSYTGSALAFTVIPRNVLGGAGFVAPSDKINLGLIGVGTQQLGELTSLIPDERVQVVSVCDPNKYPVGYKQWGVGNGLKNSVRKLLGDSSWGGEVNVTAGTTTRTVGDQDEMMEVPNNVAFPLSSVIRWKFGASKRTGPFDLFWYDGGMRPATPPELEVDDKVFESEGMMFVGDKGKILGGFRCENPVIIPESRMIEVTGAKQTGLPSRPLINATDVWINAVLNQQQSPGNIMDSWPIVETAHLAAVAFKAGKRVTYDYRSMEVTNNADANKFLYRSEQRLGWEI